MNPAAVKAMIKRLGPEDRANLMAWTALYCDDLADDGSALCWMGQSFGWSSAEEVRHSVQSFASVAM